MLGNIRKHQNWLWVIIAITVISFVFWGSQSTNQNGSRGNGNYGVINGRTITPAIFEESKREARLYYYFASGGTWPGQGRTIQGFDLEHETYNRVLITQKLEEKGIHIDTDMVAKVANERLKAFNRGNPVPLEAFEKQVLAREGLTIEDLQRFIRNELGIQHLISVHGLGGDLITPQEIRAMYVRDYQEVSAQAVFFHATNHAASVVVTPEKIGEFFTNQMANYRLPDRMQVNYVRYAATNFLAQGKEELNQVTNLDEVVEARYNELGGTNYFTETKTPDEAYAKIREEFLNRACLHAASLEAKKFDNLLYDETNLVTSALFATRAREGGLTAEVSATFDRDEPPAGLDVNASFIRSAFNLTREDPLCEPVVGQDAVYVISFNRLLPSEMPAFETIREKVTADYRFFESAMAARKAGMAFVTTATNDLAAGKTFADVCAKAGLKPFTLPLFSMKSRGIPGVDGNLDTETLKRVAFATAPGQLCPLLPSRDGACAVLVQALLPINESAMATNLPAFTRDVRQSRRLEVFNEWFRREAEKAFKDVPYFHRQQTQLSGAAPEKK